MNNLVWEIIEGVEVLDEEGNPTLDPQGDPILIDPLGRGDPGDLYVTISVDGKYTAHTLIDPPFTEAKIDAAVRAAIVAKRNQKPSPNTDMAGFMKRMDEDIRNI